MKRLVLLALIVYLGISGTGWAKSGEITVMTRNLYLGADLAPIIAAPDPVGFSGAVQVALEQVAINNFPERAAALAAEIVDKQPHLVALQEVYNFTFNGSNGPPPFRDYLADLLQALAAQGANYVVAAVVKNLDLPLPFAGNVIGVTDRDVILARGDVATAIVPLAAAGCRPSVDGCNFQTVATAASPFGPIPIERGYVAVDASISGGAIRFVNTHLEVRNIDPANPLAPALQAGQAFELVAIVGGFPNPAQLPVVVAGDFNSSPRDPVLTIGPYTIMPPYRQLVAAGLQDLWLLRTGSSPGFTCCQAEDLVNLESLLEERIDLIFSSEMPAGKVKANLLGTAEVDRTPSGLWPSDHAGLAARIQFQSE
jgi:endonuclease/exonuclease/phosphatase family metal-dependent hydrolase